MNPPRFLRLNVADPARSLAFYRDAIGFRETADGVALADTEIELMHSAGRPYPVETTACDLWFQHFAIRTADMAAAYARLCRHPHRPISLDGPQLLPRRSGGATAYKFRDPDGHPLELLQLPGDHPAGIDHTAISVADAERSIAFYRRLGFAITARQVNTGAEQDRLDGLAAVAVEVVALARAAPGPHLELLAYRTPRGRSLALRPSDIAATCIMLPGAPPSHDPDGHRILGTGGSA